MAKPDNRVWQGVAELLLILVGLIGLSFGPFDFIGRLLVHHASNTTQQEVERQRNDSK